MRPNNLLSISASVVIGAACALLSTTASAQEGGKPGVLDGKPIVVNKMELRKLRVQVTPRATMTLSQPFTHVGFVGAKLQFDLTDWLGVRGDFDYGIVQPASALTEDLTSGTILPVGDETGGGAPKRKRQDRNNPAPLQNDFQAGLTRLNWTGSAGLVFTPFAGKLGLFQSMFTEYDVYLWGGYGFTNWVEAYPDSLSTVEYSGGECEDDNNECLLHPVDAQVGTRTGPAFGAGFHIFLTDWLAVNPEFQDIIVRQNIAGLNATVGEIPIQVNGEDRTIVHNANFSLGFTVYLPPRAKRTTIKPRSGK
ncbi:MAG: outer membrane beta-barrel domain-containing protein [Myxococcales bacterium FL481]|nr:MAG: outer membrane beta-barrel domain-containing protein [Myxococcales bacterium FL481]